MLQSVVIFQKLTSVNCWKYRTQVHRWKQVSTVELKNTRAWFCSYFLPIDGCQLLKIHNRKIPYCSYLSTVDRCHLMKIKNTRASFCSSFFNSWQVFLNSWQVCQLLKMWNKRILICSYISTVDKCQLLRIRNTRISYSSVIIFHWPVSTVQNKKDKKLIWRRYCLILFHFLSK